MKDGPQARRLLALAAIYDGMSRTEAARIGGVTVQIVRDWVVRFKWIYRLYKVLGLQLRNKTPKRRVKAKLRTIVVRRFRRTKRGPWTS